jgi:mono/diheme cytochrome c family protein
MLWSGVDRFRRNQKARGRVMACALTLLAVGVGSAGRSDAQEPGNAARGRLSAGDFCADCHRTEPGAGHSPLAAAPPFAEVAKTKGMTAMALNVWLRTGHPSMPNIMLRPDTADDIIAYILSLRARTP